MKRYVFEENNSGGHWWLKREDYDKLLANGWTCNIPDTDPRAKKPWHEGDDVLYGERKYTSKEFSTIKDAVEDWQRITGRNFWEQGCNCCGAPYEIHDANYKEYITGNHAKTQISPPW